MKRCSFRNRAEIVQPFAIDVQLDAVHPPPPPAVDVQLDLVHPPPAGGDVQGGQGEVEQQGINRNARLNNQVYGLL
jgi:hypothetical protein